MPLTITPSATTGAIPWAATYVIHTDAASVAPINLRVTYADGVVETLNGIAADADFNFNHTYTSVGGSGLVTVESTDSESTILTQTCAAVPTGAVVNNPGQAGFTYRVVAGAAYNNYIVTNGDSIINGGGDVVIQ